MKIATISSKGQITLPRSIMQDLDIKPKQKIFIQRMKDGIILKPIKKSIVDELAGSLTKYIHPSKLGVPFEKIREETQRLAAEEIVKQWNK